MIEKNKAAEAAPNNTNTTNIQDPKDFTKLLAFFRYKTATTLDAMFATGILRNSITYYVAEAEQLGLLRAVFKGRDSHTGRLAKHYSADPAKWDTSKEEYQLSLWED